MSSASHLCSSMEIRDPAEERCERRYKVPDGVKLSLQVPPDEVTEEVVLCDISLRGFGIETARYIEPGTSVVLRMGSRRIEAEVKHCDAENHGYRVGVLVHRSVNERFFAIGGCDWDTLLARSRPIIGRQ